jgi:hypothetical protein
VLVLATAWVAAEAAVPEITDTDYYIRLRVIRAAAAEQPNRPLGVVLGSSRVLHAFQPEHLSGADGDTLWVSAAHMGSGPALNRLILHNLLRDGVRPTVVVIEMMPTFFAKENEGFVSTHFAVADLPLVRRYADEPFGYDYHFLRHRLRRIGDLARAPDPFAGRGESLPRGGMPPAHDEITAAERASYLALARTANAALRSMTVRPAADRAFRDTLREAAAHGIRVVLLRTPEGPIFRSWYDPAGLAKFDEYVSRAASEHGASVLDARFWLDEEDFYDSHHVLKRGAEKFTARFAREVPAVLAGR